MLTAKKIKIFHDKYLSNENWPDKFTFQYETSRTIFKFIEANHYFNTKLWNEEDLARRQKVSDTEIASNKRAIDKFNQQRNDCIEKIDEFIINKNPKILEMSGMQNSETLGSIVDRLSILSLKIFHMTLQTKRIEVSRSHKEDCQKKLSILITQRNDLGKCFDDLLLDCANGVRYFKQYKQYKMYNDPNLNPQIYNETNKKI